MPDDLPIPRQEGRSEDVATVQWGTDDPPHRGWAARFFGGLGRDPRIPPIIAGLGAVATFAAMTSDWVVTTLPDSGPDGGPVSLPSGVSDLGNLGTAYLLGVLAVLGCLALLLFGSAGIRYNAAIVGLALAVGTGGMLLAITLTAEDGLPAVYIDPGRELEVTPGRGLIMAYVGTTAFTAALLLGAGYARSMLVQGAFGDAAVANAGGPGAGSGDRAGGSAGVAAHPGTGAAADGVPGWPWRRPRGEPPEADDGLPPPADLTVTPAPPFTRLDPPAGPTEPRRG